MEMFSTMPTLKYSSCEESVLPESSQGLMLGTSIDVGFQQLRLKLLLQANDPAPYKLLD
jgi:hypothetical protein